MGFYILTGIFILALCSQSHATRPSTKLGKLVTTIFGEKGNTRQSHPKNTLEDYERYGNTNSEHNTHAALHDTQIDIIKKFMKKTRRQVTASLVDNDAEEMIMKLDRKGKRPLYINLTPYDPLERKTFTIQENSRNKYPVVLQIGRKKYPITLKVNEDGFESDEEDSPFPVVKLTTKDDASEDSIRLRRGDASAPVLKLIKRDYKKSRTDEMRWPFPSIYLDDSTLNDKEEIRNRKPRAKLKMFTKSGGPSHSKIARYMILNVKRNGLDEGGEMNRKKNAEINTKLTEASEDNDVKIAKLIKEKIQKSRITA